MRVPTLCHDSRGYGQMHGTLCRYIDIPYASVRGGNLARPVRARPEPGPILTGLDGPIIKWAVLGLMMVGPIGPLGFSCLYTCIHLLNILTFLYLEYLFISFY